MSQKIHCECCDRVIADNEVFLGLRPAKKVGSTLYEADDYYDFCTQCLDTQPMKIILILMKDVL